MTFQSLGSDIVARLLRESEKMFCDSATTNKPSIFLYTCLEFESSAYDNGEEVCGLPNPISSIAFQLQRPLTLAGLSLVIRVSKG